jgi:hypothetical protein
MANFEFQSEQSAAFLEFRHLSSPIEDYSGRKRLQSRKPYSVRDLAVLAHTDFMQIEPQLESNLSVFIF